MGIAIIKEFSLRQPNGKLKYFAEYKCYCGKIFIARRDRRANSSCGCLRASLNRKRRLGKPAYNRIKGTELAILSAARGVYRSSKYNDSDISFEKFISLSKLPCHYCGIIEANQTHLGIKKNGEQRSITRKDSEGNPYKAMAWGSYLPDAHFKYNGLDRIDPTKLHSLDNVVTCCKMCNFMKTNKNYEVFVNQIHRMSQWLKKQV